MRKSATCCIGFILFSLSSIFCGKKGGPCEESLRLSSSEIVMTFKDSSGSYLYQENDPLSGKDSLKVFDQNGQQLILLSVFNQIPNTSFKYYEISFGPLYEGAADEASYTTEHCKNFIIRYNSTHTDTLKTCFTAAKTACGSIFETLKVYQRGIALASVHNTTFARVTIIK